MSIEHDQSNGEPTTNHPVDDVESEDDLTGDVEDGKPVLFRIGELPNLARSSQLRLGHMLQDSISPNFTSSISKWSAPHSPDYEPTKMGIWKEWEYVEEAQEFYSGV